MAESTLESGPDGSDEPPGFSATFEKLQQLLKSKDDTSRFVGLALLKSLLDHDQLVRPEHLRVLWHSISPKFLDRLLRAQQNEKLDKGEAKSMVDLAVAVLHTFTVLLPEALRKAEQFTERTAPLVYALVQSSPETMNLILQTLLTIVSQPEGALSLLGIKDWSAMVEISPQDPLVLDIFLFTWVNAAAVLQNAIVQASIDETLSALIIQFQDTDTVTLLTFVEKLLPQLSSEVLPRNPKWLKPLILSICKLVYSRPTLASRTAYMQLAASLLQSYPTITPPLLFAEEPKGVDKPFSYLFINLVLIDLRASFPTLLSQLNSPEYPANSQRLVAAFDIVSSFIGYLVKSLDQSDFSMPPDLLLKLRKDIAETISLTIEFLRDRWDASVAGASGLDPSVRYGTATTSEGTRLTLTWDSKTDSINSDSLILAAIQTVAIWIREDENDNLRNEAAGLMDMFIELYKMPDALDFRFPILLALEGVLLTEDALESFLAQAGWQVLFQDLEGILRGADVEGEASRGIEVVRVLLSVVDHSSITYPREDWMKAINTTISIKLSSSASTSLHLELQIAALQLSMALLSKSAVGVQKRYIDSIVALSGLAHRLDTLVGDLEDESESQELSSLLQGVFLDLHNLRSDMV